MVGPTMQRVSSLVSKDISNYLTNRKVWGGIIYNVLEYGAKGDGSTDDAASIQSAITAANSDGDGTVFFPPGSYAVSSALTLPAGVNILAYGAKLVVPKDNLFVVITITDGSNQRIEGLTIEETSHAYTQRASGSGIVVSGDSQNVILENVSVIGCHDGIVIMPDTGDLATQIVVNNCRVEYVARYGFNIGNVEEVEMNNCKAFYCWLDGIKLRRNTKDVKIYGGVSSHNGASIVSSGNGNGIDGFPGAGNLIIDGLTTEHNNGSGVYIKTGNLNEDTASNEGKIRNIQLSNLQSRFNLNSGLDINRIDGDTFPYPLITHVNVIGGVFESNTDRGIYIRARNVTLVSPLVKNNDQDGIIVLSTAFDVSITSPIVTANGRADSSLYAGINIQGKRVSVIGGTINGCDGDFISDDTYSGLTIHHQYSIRVTSTADNVEIRGVKSLNFNYAHQFRVDTTGYVHIDYGNNAGLRNTFGGIGSTQVSSGIPFIKNSASNSTTGWIRRIPSRLTSKTIGTSQTTVAHGLGYAPSNVSVILRANGTIWESATADSTNIYLTAAASTLCDILVW